MLGLRNGPGGLMAFRSAIGAVRTLFVAGIFALGSGLAHAATLDVNFTISNNGPGVTAAVLHIVSSTVADFTNYSGTLVSCTACGPPITASGQLNNGATDSTIVTTGSDGGTYDLVVGHFQATNATTIVLTNGAVTSISWSDYIFAESNDHSCGICILSLSGTKIGAYFTSSDFFLDADLTLPGPSATPLPAALPLFVSGLGVIGFAVRRKKRKALA